MSEVVREAQQEFWRPPAVQVEAARPGMVEVCSGCATEFMVGSLFLPRLWSASRDSVLMPHALDHLS